MGLLITAAAPSSATVSLCSWKDVVRGKPLIIISSSNSNYSLTTTTTGGSTAKVRASFNCFFDPQQQPPILKEALKEPVAFLGGIFAGLLRLDLTEEPLKEWVARTVEASGISEEELSKTGVEGDEEETPQQIEIE